MRNSIRFAAMGAALATAVSFGSAANAAATASATATAEILSTLTVTNTRGLDFGQVAVNGAGTLRVAGDGSITCSANLVCTGTRQTAAFNVTGTSGVAYSAVVTTASVPLSSGANTMTLNNFSVYFPDGTTLVAGASSFNVGGTLNVGASQAAGLYSGNFTVSVEYQ
ncbi:MAG TPA: DUF4402 domain-containing protein [Novosphingobium sp.]|nr:DUF4402 domain-containing protein [Novosphingobium sp.]